MKTVLVWVLFGAATLLFSGCVETPDSPGRVGAIFDDVPAPLGFAMDRQQTYGHTYPALRVYTQVFRGRTTVESVAEYYKAQMPVNDWTLASADEASKENVKLSYTKDVEICTVNVYSESIDSTVVKIVIGKK